MERKQNVAEIKRLIQERKEAVSSFSALTRFLIGKGVARSIAEDISIEFAEQKAELSDLKELLAKRIKTIGDLSTHSFVALVGPTGVGKTTTLIKLALTLKKTRSLNVGVFSLEPNELLSLAAEKWDLSYSSTGCDLVLIDTPGCSFYQPGQIDVLGERLGAFKEVEILLILSANTKDVDLYGAIHQFSSLQPSSFIFTKLDETLAPGALINICQKTDLPLRYITFGHLLPGDIQIADPYKITHKILTGFNEVDLHYLRQIAQVYE